MRPSLLAGVVTRGRRIRVGLGSLCVAASLISCSDNSLILPAEGDPVALAVLSGEGQADTVGRPLPDLLILRITDSKDRPVQGQRVSFTPLLNGDGAQLTPDTAVSDADGQAQTRWVLGTRVGPQTLRAQVLGAGSAALKVDFTAVASADAPSTMILVGGDAQSDTVDALLTLPLVVRVTDQFDNGLGGVEIDWTTHGGGELSSTTTTTDANGRAEVERTLGAVAGPQSTTATAPGLEIPPLTFSHDASPGRPIGLRADSGDGQVAHAGVSLDDRLVVRLVDGKGNGITGSAVAWAVASGGGVVAPTSEPLDTAGRASTNWTLGPVAGLNTAFASASGFSVLFSATGIASQPTQIAANSPTNLSGAAGSGVTPLPSVKVTDSNNNPVQGVSVNFAATSGGGVVAPGTVLTDAGGVATVGAWILGATAGSNTLKASASGPGGPLGGSPVVFTATGAAAQPARIIANSATTLSGPAGGSVAPAPSVKVTDANNNPVQGVEVSFAVLAGGGTVPPGTVRTDAAGVATVGSWTLGPAAGNNTLTASAFGGSGALAGSPVIFTAIGNTVNGSPATVTVTVQPSTPVQNTVAFPTQPQVRVQDAQGNLLGGVAVNATIATGTGALNGSAAVLTNGSGIAMFADLSLTGATGVRTLRFTAGAASATSGAITVTPGPVSAAHSSATVPNGSVGNTTNIAVQTRDVSDNLTSSAAIVVITVSGANSASPPVTDHHDGSLSASYTPSVGGTDNVAISAGGAAVSGSPYTSAVQSGAVSGLFSTVSVSPAAIAASTGSSFSTVTVTAKGIFGNPIGGALVSFSAAGPPNGNSFTPATASTDASGHATTSFSSTQAGAKIVSATAGGVKLLQSQTVTVGPDVTDAAHSTAMLPHDGHKGRTSVITVHSKDQFGNDVHTGGHAVVMTVTGDNPTGPIAAVDIGNGGYIVSYTPPDKGEDDLAITLDGTPISGSPFHFRVH